MKPLHIETPFFESHPLSLQAGRSVWLKLEALQAPGSFKIRGIGRACQEYARRGAHRFISSSGGNAGIAVAYAGRHLAVPVVVVVPETTTERARQLIEQEGAEVMVYGTHNVVVSDKAAVLACQKFIIDHRIVVEPACGAALATVYERMAEIEPFQSIAVIVCGGATASIEQLNQWSKL